MADQGKRTKAVTAGKVKQQGVKLGGELKFEKNAKFLDSRVEIWNGLFNKQQEVYKKFPNEEIKVTMPDGSVKTGKSFETSPYDIAKGISSQFADKCIVAKVRYAKRVATLDEGLLNPEAEEGKDEQDQWYYWDINRKLEGDCELFLYKFDNEEGRETFWHSSAHILGQVLEQEYGVKLTIGPPTENGFFYDSYTGKNIFKEDDYSSIEKAAKKLCDSKQQFDRLVLTKEEALELFGDNPFKVSLISEKIPAGGKVTAYKCGKLIDLCTGPHIPSTKVIKAFKVTKNSASHWLGKVENDSLQRVYGITFPSKKEMDEYVHRMEEAAKRDHRTIAKQQKLFNINELSPGCAFFEPRGMFIYNKLCEIIKDEYRVRGYQEVLSPNIFNLKLWKTSGHYSKYKENLFIMKCEHQGFGLKPMNCPAHCLMFSESLRSWRELPLRLADFGVLHRNEIAGALSGLTRVRRFQQDDAHHFCTMDQIQGEINLVLDFLEHIYGIFEFEWEIELSTRPEARLGSDEVWDKAEGALESALNKFGKPWKLNPGDGAFYGPKIDIKVLDALKRAHQCGTIQLDFQLPIRFDLQYKTNEVLDTPEEQNEHKVYMQELFKPDEYDEDEFEWKERPIKKGFARPVMIHRAVLGSVERFMAILIEHTAGKWPFFISPRQAIIVPISEKYNDYCQSVYLYLHRLGYQTELDLSNNTLNKKILMNQKAQWNFILVAGEKEAEAGTVDVRTRENKRIGAKRIDQLHEYLQALLPKHSKAHVEFYKNQWNVDNFAAEDKVGHGHDHDEKQYFVNQEDLNLYLDNAQNRMGLMIQTVAEIAQAKINVRFAQDAEAPTLMKKYPYLVTENETIFDAEAIAQHIARFNPQAGLNGNTQFQKAMVNEWISWCQLKWIPVMHGPLMPVLGYGQEFDQEKYTDALGATMQVAIELDQHLKHQHEGNNVEWIVCDKISLADVFIGSCFVTVFQTLFDEGVRNEVPYLSKWFDRFAKHHSVVGVFGAIKQCKKAIKPAGSGEKSPTPPATIMKQQTVLFNKKKNTPGKKDEKEDSFGEDDLFGDDNEADKEAAKKIAEAAKKNNKKDKKKKKEVIAQSLVMFEVKPADSETDLDKLSQQIFKIKMDGLYWKTQYKKEPVAFGIFKLLIGVTVEDEKVSVDGLQEKIEEFEGVQSVDILAFNKI